jgi:hypothetical protein
LALAAAKKTPPALAGPPALEDVRQRRAKLAAKLPGLKVELANLLHLIAEGQSHAGGVAGGSGRLAGETGRKRSFDPGREGELRSQVKSLEGEIGQLDRQADHLQRLAARPALTRPTHRVPALQEVSTDYAEAVARRTALAGALPGLEAELSRLMALAAEHKVTSPRSLDHDARTAALLGEKPPEVEVYDPRRVDELNAEIRAHKAALWRMDSQIEKLRHLASRTVVAQVLPEYRRLMLALRDKMTAFESAYSDAKNLMSALEGQNVSSTLPRLGRLDIDSIRLAVNLALHTTSPT